MGWNPGVREEVRSDMAVPGNHCAAEFQKQCRFYGLHSPHPNNKRSGKILPQSLLFLEF